MIHSFIHLSTHLLTYSSISPLKLPPFLTFTHSSLNFLIKLYFIASIMHSFINSFTNAFIHSFTHKCIHPFVNPSIHHAETRFKVRQTSKKHQEVGCAKEGNQGGSHTYPHITTHTLGHTYAYPHIRMTTHK